MKYTGNELQLFSQAINWKAYWSSFFQPYVKGDVLEVGAGLGSSTIALSGCQHKSWTCLEPDPDLSMQLVDTLKKYNFIDNYKILDSNLDNMANSGYYDTILYIDVLEHIEDDYNELQSAKKLLSDTGTLIILSPAHQWLFSEFDEAIGHHRRYTKATLLKIIPDELNLINIRYLDSIGLFASLANRVLMRKSIPSMNQIKFWDRVMVPCSRIIDPIIFFNIGKSILGIWQK